MRSITLKETSPLFLLCCSVSVGKANTQPATNALYSYREDHDRMCIRKVLPRARDRPSQAADWLDQPERPAEERQSQTILLYHSVYSFVPFPWNHWTNCGQYNNLKHRYLWRLFHPIMEICKLIRRKTLLCRPSASGSSIPPSLIRWVVKRWRHGVWQKRFCAPD